MMCSDCGGYHYFENEKILCLERTNLVIPTETIIEDILDANISNPPDWVQELDFPPTAYFKSDPNASWNQPK